MPRNQPSPSNTSAQISVRTDEELKRRYKAALDEQDKSMSEDIRQHMEKVVAECDREYDHDHDHDLPASEHLREAYLKLVEEATERIEGAGLRITKEEAENLLYTNRVPKDSVMKALIRPLKQAGYVRIDTGMQEVWLVVRPRESNGGTGSLPEPRTDTSEST